MKTFFKGNWNCGATGLLHYDNTAFETPRVFLGHHTMVSSSDLAPSKFLFSKMILVLKGSQTLLSLLATITLEVVPFHMYALVPMSLAFFKKCILEIIFCESVQQYLRFCLDHSICAKLVTFQLDLKLEEQTKIVLWGVGGSSLLPQEFGAFSHIFVQHNRHHNRK